MQYEAVVIGVSAGGLHALEAVLAPLPSQFSLPIVVVQHQHKSSDDFLVTLLNERCNLTVKQAENRERLAANTVYFSTPDYHLEVDNESRFRLTQSPPVNYARPSIDVLFRSAAVQCALPVIGVILTGANNDGALGLRAIKEAAGYAIVEDPDSAEAAVMPRRAMEETKVDQVLRLSQIGPALWDLQRASGSSSRPG